MKSRHSTRHTYSTNLDLLVSKLRSSLVWLMSKHNDIPGLTCSVNSYNLIQLYGTEFYGAWKEFQAKTPGKDDPDYLKNGYWRTNAALSQMVALPTLTGLQVSEDTKPPLFSVLQAADHVTYLLLTAIKKSLDTVSSLNVLRDFLCTMKVGEKNSISITCRPIYYSFIPATNGWLPIINGEIVQKHRPWYSLAEVIAQMLECPEIEGVMAVDKDSMSPEWIPRMMIAALMRSHQFIETDMSHNSDGSVQHRDVLAASFTGHKPSAVTPQDIANLASSFANASVQSSDVKYDEQHWHLVEAAGFDTGQLAPTKTANEGGFYNSIISGEKMIGERAVPVDEADANTLAYLLTTVSSPI